ncbi:DMT family transporter [Neogemmobacter tilapiae]|uniref:DMT transporter permease n=1 Tax=Neogemmobacter tilapiae TaxID=875041 RepID=A0A918TKH7_9RHOB|nr:DMT family transporter [Gemmobacter tilapiae]GHC46066.1 DMT transporter permease [Gemmobacter tilapiae]
MKSEQRKDRAVVAGVALMVLATLSASGADAALKAVATGYAAPQILFIAALMSMGLTLLANGRGGFDRVSRTGAPWAMALRALATVLAAIGFYNAFVRLPFSEVFLFIGIMPLLAAALSGPILGEKVGLRVWAILGLGLLGMGFLFAHGTTPDLAGHAFALLGAFAGTLSVVLSRHIGRHQTHSLAQVFLPQSAMAVVMGLWLPFEWQTMGGADFALVALYALLVFAGRWIMVIVARLIPTWLSLQILNLQFVWMVILGYVVFHEATGLNVVVGAGLILLAGGMLARDEFRKTARIGAAEGWKAGLRDGLAQVRSATTAQKI